MYCAHTCIGFVWRRVTYKGEEQVAGHAVPRLGNLEESRRAIRVLLDLGGDGGLPYARIQSVDLPGRRGLSN
jgi:hypothetical protein